MGKFWVPPSEIVAWITYRGRRIPITRRALRGAEIGSAEQCTDLVRRLRRAVEGSTFADTLELFTELRPIKMRSSDWLSVIRAVRRVDRRFPGLMEGVVVYPVRFENDIKGFTIHSNITFLGGLHVRDTIKALRAGKSFEVFGMPVKPEETALLADEIKAQLPEIRHLERVYRKELRHVPIFFSPQQITPLFTKTCCQTTEDAFVHEMGHVLTARLKKRDLIRWHRIFRRERDKIWSDYGRTNPGEGMAEEFVLFVKKGKCSTPSITQFFESVQRQWGLL